MDIKDLSLDELKIITSVIIKTNYVLGDAKRILPIYQKLYDTIQKLDPILESKKEDIKKP